MVTLKAIILFAMTASQGYLLYDFPGVLKKGMSDVMNLAKAGPVYSQYMKPPIIPHSKYFMYETINPGEVLRGKKANFRLRGPVVFTSEIRRLNGQFKDDDTVLSYETGRLLYLDEENSVDLDREIYSPNMILAAIHSQIKDALKKVPFGKLSEPLVYGGVNVMLDNFNERLFVRTTLRDLLMDRNIRLLQTLMGIADRFGLKNLLPPAPPKAGFAYVQNITLDKWEIYTGVGPSKGRMGDVKSWHDKTVLDLYTGVCNRIDGTNGELFKPFLGNVSSRIMFMGQLCRTISLELVKPEKHNIVGVETYEYMLSPKLFKGVRSEPSNKCYCQNSKTYDCQLDGLANMSPCFFGSPLYFSKGNMYGADRRIRDTIGSGVEDPRVASDEKFWIEPITGTVVEVNLTLMANIKVLRQRYMRDLSGVRNLTYMPAFVVNEVFRNHKSIFFVTTAISASLLILHLMKGDKKNEDDTTKKKPNNSKVAALDNKHESENDVEKKVHDENKGVSLIKPPEEYHKHKKGTEAKQKPKHEDDDTDIESGISSA